MAEKNQWVYDELLEFLGNPLFQIPVVTFLEAHCLVFDSSTEDNEEYRKIHTEYKQLIESLLDSFRSDTGLSHKQIIDAFTQMHNKEDIRVFFQGLLEQVLAGENYDIFVQLMVQKNLELQQQALLLIFQTIGCIPTAFQTNEPSNPIPVSSNEVPIMEAVFNETKKNGDLLGNCDVDMKNFLVISEAEAAMLVEQTNKEQEKMEAAVKKLSLASTGGNKDDKKLESPKVPELRTKPPESFEVPVEAKTLNLPNKTVSFANMPEGDAASLIESNKSTIPILQNTVSKLNPEDLKKRQEFLRQQRDKLIEMKKNERKKQLMKAEKEQPQRPKSARTAHSVLSVISDGHMPGGEQLKDTPNKIPDSKAMSMRRVIADRIKLEVMSKK